MDALELGYRLRQAIPWSPVPAHRPVRLEHLRTALTPAGRQAMVALERRLDLSFLDRATDVHGAAEALWAAAMVDIVLQAVPSPPPGPALDVGAKNAVHLPGLYAARPGPWDLVELDPQRRYADLTTRGAWGGAMARRFRAARYIAADINDHRGRYALITWILPFVTPGPHEAWGLPGRLFRPDRTLAHVVSLLAEGGVLAIINQGPTEAAIQQELIASQASDLDVIAWGVLPETLSPYRHPRHLTIIRRS
jgi:hypothetical protein